MNNTIHEYKANQKGRDFVVGDVHGMYDMLMTELDLVDFDKSKDRLFSVGDLIDRGPDSIKCLRLINEPWFFACLGNHEEMMLNSCVLKREAITSLWVRNGGEWGLKLTKDEVFECVSLIRKLPMAIGIRTNKGLIGICHAQAPLSNKWADVVKEESGATMLWGRRRIEENDRTIVEGVYKAIHGHSIVNDVLSLGNTLFIDTGDVRGLDNGYKLTVMPVVDCGEVLI